MEQFIRSFKHNKTKCLVPVTGRIVKRLIFYNVVHFVFNLLVHFSFAEVHKCKCCALCWKFELSRFFPSSYDVGWCCCSWLSRLSSEKFRFDAVKWIAVDKWQPHWICIRVCYQSSADGDAKLCRWGGRCWRPSIEGTIFARVADDGN